MKKVISVLLATIIVTVMLSPMVFAYTDRQGLVSDQSITQIIDSGVISFYLITIHTGDVITLKAVDSNGKQTKVPKGCHAEWTTEPNGLDSCKLKLTPSSDGNTCSVKATKGGTGTLVQVNYYDKNGNRKYHGSCIIQTKYNVAEWIAEYVTLGLYGVCWERIPAYFEEFGATTLFYDEVGFIGDMLMPWARFI